MQSVEGSRVTREHTALSFWLSMCPGDSCWWVFLFWHCHGPNVPTLGVGGGCGGGMSREIKSQFWCHPPSYPQPRHSPGRAPAHPLRTVQEAPVWGLGLPEQGGSQTLAPRARTKELLHLSLSDPTSPVEKDMVGCSIAGKNLWCVTFLLLLIITVTPASFGPP